MLYYYKMSPRTETFYYSASSKRAMQQRLQSSPGRTTESIIPLYFDKQLTKKIGSLKYNAVLVDNTQPYPVVSVNARVITDNGTIFYEYIKSDYKPITVDTQQTSGIYTKGIVTRTYETSNKEIRKIVYRSTE